MKKIVNRVVMDMTADEIAENEAQQAEWAAGENDRLAKDVRNQRDGLLAATDWMALSDVTMSDTMTAYRQALRDIPSQAGFPSSVTWPTKPE
jgi:hypothetical protein